MKSIAFFTTGQVAKRLGVHPHTLRKWEYAGRVPRATKRNGRRVYTPTEIRQIESLVFEKFHARAGSQQ